MYIYRIPTWSSLIVFRYIEGLCCTQVDSMAEKLNKL